jgi:antitoxin ParD1/3/4
LEERGEALHFPRLFVVLFGHEKSTEKHCFPWMQSCDNFCSSDAILMYICIINNIAMARQSISLTKPNDEWLKAQVDLQEYTSKSELVNDLIRQARQQQAQIDWLKSKLEKAENSGFTADSKEDIRNQSKSSFNG